MKAVIYTRFSPRPDAATTESIETQLDLCRAFAAEHGWEIGGEYEDRGISGGDADRPGLWAAVESLKRGDVLLAYRRDRIARDVYLWAILQRALAKAHATVAVVVGGVNGDSPEDRMVLTILDAFDQYMREVGAARTKAAMLRHQATGRRMGSRIPYGWKADPADPARIVEDAGEQLDMRVIRAFAESGLGVRAIVSKLTKNGVPCRGHRWYPSLVERILAKAT